MVLLKYVASVLCFLWNSELGILHVLAWVGKFSIHGLLWRAIFLICIKANFDKPPYDAVSGVKSVIVRVMCFYQAFGCCANKHRTISTAVQRLCLLFKWYKTHIWTKTEIATLARAAVPVIHPGAWGRLADFSSWSWRFRFILLGGLLWRSYVVAEGCLTASGMWQVPGNCQISHWCYMFRV